MSPRLFSKVEQFFFFSVCLRYVLNSLVSSSTSTSTCCILKPLAQLQCNLSRMAQSINTKQPEGSRESVHMYMQCNYTTQMSGGVMWYIETRWIIYQQVPYGGNHRFCVVSSEGSPHLTKCCECRNMTITKSMNALVTMSGYCKEK